MSDCKHRNGLKCNLFSNDWSEARCRIKYKKECPYHAPVTMTNYDQIVNKTPEELAEWLADILNHCENKKPEELCRMSCPLYKCCTDQPSDNIEDWLKATVEDGA